MVHTDTCFSPHCFRIGFIIIISLLIIRGAMELRPHSLKASWQCVLMNSPRTLGPCHKNNQTLLRRGPSRHRDRSRSTLHSAAGGTLLVARKKNKKGETLPPKPPRNNKTRNNKKITGGPIDRCLSFSSKTKKDGRHFSEQDDKLDYYGYTTDTIQTNQTRRQKRPMQT